jgi:hypothetical protein
MANDNLKDTRTQGTARMRRKMYTSGEVAAEVAMPRWQLQYQIETKQLPGPSCTVPGRRLFTADDIRNIKAALLKRAESLAATARRSRATSHAGTSTSPVHSTGTITTRTAALTTGGQKTTVE